jgi:hypothetical protein
MHLDSCPSIYCPDPFYVYHGIYGHTSNIAKLTFQVEIQFQRQL